VNQPGPYLLVGRHVEQQVRLDEGFGILVEEGHLLCQETPQEAGMDKVRPQRYRYVMIMIRTTT